MNTSTIHTAGNEQPVLLQEERGASTGHHQFVIEASVSNPVLDRAPAPVATHTTDDRLDAATQALLFLHGGYWVEVYCGESRELLAGPFDPDKRLPRYVL